MTSRSRCTSSSEHVSVMEDSFELIRLQCWHNGRPLIPVFGAGISVESGIPLMRSIGDYLRELRLYLSLIFKTPLTDLQDYGRKYLTQFGWPDRHLLRQYVREQSLSDPQNIHCMQEKLNDSAMEWSELLASLTVSDDSLKDLLFSQLIADARPSTPHQYAAYLAGIMNWQLMITTNFDPLLETAVHEQGRDVAVYELLPHAELPDAALVKKRPSVMKLHGGTYSLLAGSILNVPIPYKTKEQFLRFFPADAMLLILGYSGNDARVLGLIKAVCKQTRDRLAALQDTSEPVTAIWVYRSQLPPDHESLFEAGVRFEQYQGSGSYLQELYTRITSALPVSTTSFRALAHVPPHADNSWLESHVTSNDLKEAQSAVFIRQANDFGTSSALVSNMHSLPRTFDPIWCQLDRIDTVNSLITHLERQFRRVDPDLPVFSLFRRADHENKVPADADLELPEFTKQDARLNWILRAMQRHDYAIAIDGIGEFGSVFNSLPNGRSEDPLRRKELKKLRKFLESLISRSSEFGRSKLRISDTLTNQLDIDWSKHEREIPNAKQLIVFDVSEKISVSFEKGRPHNLNPHIGSPNAMTALRNLISESFARDLLKECRDSDGTSRRSLLVNCADLFWKESKDKAELRILLAVACVFRRSRPVGALRRLVIPLWIHHRRSADPDAWKSFAESPWEEALPTAERDKLGDMLKNLCDAGVMSKQEGGFCWIHRAIREALWSQVEQELGGADSKAVARLHDHVATFYYEHVFRRSKDHEAMVEYLHHRATSLRNGSPGEMVARLSELRTVLSRERDHLLSQSQAETLIRWATHFNESVLSEVESAFKSNSSLRAQAVQLREVFCDLQAEVLRQKSDCKGRINLRIKQIADRVNELKAFFAVNDTQSGPVRRSCQVFQAFLEKMQNALSPFEDPDRWHTYGEIPDDENAKDRVTLRSFVDQTIGVLKELDQNFASEPRNEMIDRFTQKQASKALHRLADHLVDICATATRLGLDGHSNTPQSFTLLKVLRTIAERVESIAATDGRTISPGNLKWMLRLRIRSSFRAMEAALTPITPWRKPKGYENLLRIAEDEFTVGQRNLREYAGVEPRDHQHYACFLNTLRARAAYYHYDSNAEVPSAEQFLRAHELLDSAVAAISSPVSGSEYSALSVCHLHRAECLMLDANHWINAPISNATRARTFILRARNSLSLAKSLLAQGRPDVATWSWFYQLQAQLEHEWLIHPYHLGHDQYSGEDLLPGSDSNMTTTTITEDELKKGCVSVAEIPGRAQSFIQGLRAVDYGLQCARSDPGRVKQLRCLQRQLEIWFWASQHALRRARADGALQGGEDFIVLKHAFRCVAMFADEHADDCEDQTLDDRRGMVAEQIDAIFPNIDLIRPGSAYRLRTAILKVEEAMIAGNRTKSVAAPLIETKSPDADPASKVLVASTSSGVNEK